MSFIRPGSIGEYMLPGGISNITRVTPEEFERIRKDITNYLNLSLIEMVAEGFVILQDWWYYSPFSIYGLFPNWSAGTSTSTIGKVVRDPKAVEEMMSPKANPLLKDIENWIEGVTKWLKTWPTIEESFEGAQRMDIVPTTEDYGTAVLMPEDIYWRTLGGVPGPGMPFWAYFTYDFETTMRRAMKKWYPKVKKPKVPKEKKPPKPGKPRKPRWLAAKPEKSARTRKVRIVRGTGITGAAFPYVVRQPFWRIRRGKKKKPLYGIPELEEILGGYL